MNFRLLVTGLLLGILAGGFFLYMAEQAPKSTDPHELMRIVGMVAGVAGGLGLALMLMGLLGVGRKRR